MIHVDIDTRALYQTAHRQALKYRAVALTLSNPGQGEVVVSARKRMITDPPGRAMHGKFIANFLTSKGHDPFDYPVPVIRHAEGELSARTSALELQAFRTGRHTTKDLREALEAAAAELAAWAVENIAKGGLGENTERQARAKATLGRARAGVTAIYGVPPPYGIRSGRFIGGIRARWRIGRFELTGGGYRADTWADPVHRPGATSTIRVMQ